MTESRFLHYGRQHVDEDDVRAVVEVLRGDFLTQGPAVPRFEEALAERVGARHAVAVSSGTAALHIACLAAGLEPGQRGVTSPLTFVASANAFRYCGAEVELADIDSTHLGISARSLTANLHDDVRVVMPVHYAGLAAEAAEIRAAAGDRMVIEDASHALGAHYASGEPIGSNAHADLTVFSFHPVKPITTAEGGAVTTNDDKLAHRLRMLRSHGIEREPDRLVAAPRTPQPWYYEQQALGFNYRMSDLHAALGHSQLQRLDVFLARRREIVARYDAAFAVLPHLILPQSAPENRARSSHHLYVLLVDFAALGTDRAAFLDRLAAHGVGGQVHYIPVYRQPFHAGDRHWQPAAFPTCEAVYQSCLSIPVHADLTDEEVDRVIEAVSDAVRT